MCVHFQPWLVTTIWWASRDWLVCTHTQKFQCGVSVMTCHPESQNFPPKFPPSSSLSTDNCRRVVHLLQFCWINVTVEYG